MAQEVPPPYYPPAQQPYPPEPQQGYPAQYPPQQQTATTTVVVTQPTIVTHQVFKDYPVTITDSRGQQVQTILEYRSGMLTWAIFAVICFITGCICFAVIPFCIDATKDVYHISPTDGTIVGIYKRI